VRPRGIDIVFPFGPFDIYSPGEYAVLLDLPSDLGSSWIYRRFADARRCPSTGKIHITERVQRMRGHGGSWVAVGWQFDMPLAYLLESLEFWREPTRLLEHILNTYGGKAAYQTPRNSWVFADTHIIGLSDSMHRHCERLP